MKAISGARNRFLAAFTSELGINLIQFTFIGVIAVYTLTQRVFWMPDILGLLLAISFVLTGRGAAFIRDWLPFIFLLLAYDAFRGVADDLSGRVYFTEPINAELAIFGFMPTFKLQELLYVPGQVQWYDNLFASTYVLHFFLPLLMGVWLWRRDRREYKSFVLTLLVLSYAGFLTFLAIPVAPPWMAMRDGYLDQSAARIVFEVTSSLGATQFPTLYGQMNPNPVAAFPSLHSAYPWLAFLFLVRHFRWWALPVVLYPVSVWIMLVYSGEHYVVDVIGGVTYASVSYGLCATSFLPRLWALLLRRSANARPGDARGG